MTLSSHSPSSSKLAKGVAGCLAAIILASPVLAQEHGLDSLWPLGRSEVELKFLNGTRLCVEGDETAGRCRALLEIFPGAAPEHVSLRMAAEVSTGNGPDRTLVVSAQAQWSGSRLCFWEDETFMRTQTLLEIDRQDPFAGIPVPEPEQAQWSQNHVNVLRFLAPRENCLRFYQAEDDDTRLYLSTWTRYKGVPSRTSQETLTVVPWGQPLGLY